MKGFVGVTDNEWFAFLSQQPEIGEVIFYGGWRFRSFHGDHNPSTTCDRE
jgi:hypothetical protein